MAVTMGPSLGFLGGGVDLVLIDKDIPLANSSTLTVLDGVLVSSGSRLAAKSIGSGVYQFGLVRTGGGSAIENIEAGIRVGGTASTVRGTANSSSLTSAIVANFPTAGGTLEFVARGWASNISASSGWMMMLARWGAMPRQVLINTSTGAVGSNVQLWPPSSPPSPAVVGVSGGIINTTAGTVSVVAAALGTYPARSISVEVRKNGTGVATSTGGYRGYAARWTGPAAVGDQFTAYGTGTSTPFLAAGGKFTLIAHDGRAIGTSTFTMTSQTVEAGGDTITSFTPTGQPPALHTGAQAIITGTGTATVTGKLTRSSATPTNQVALLLNGAAIATQTWGASDSSEKTFSWTGSLTYGDILEYRSTWTGSGTQTFTSGQLTITGS